MASKERDPIDRAQRKVDKARRKLEAAREEHAQTRERGKQEIEKARLHAAVWLAEATDQVDRRAAKLARLEAQLAELRGEDLANAVVARAPVTPEETVEVLEHHEVLSEYGLDTAAGSLARE